MRFAASEPAVRQLGLHFRPDKTIGGRSAIDVYDNERHAATIYVTRSGLHVACESGYAPGKLTIERHPDGVQLEIEERSR
jgi:hypothetical protein